MYPKILDVSHWQGDIDWNKFMQSDAEGCIIRAGSCNANSGIPYTDYKYEQNMTAVEHFTDVIGTYWYWRPSHDPIEQADYYADLLKFKNWNLAPVADVESWENVGISTMQARLKRFVDRLEYRTGRKPLIYTRTTFWNPYVRNPSWASDHDLWIARYNSTITGPWDDGWGKPYSWNDWVFWQYSADGNGLGHEYGIESADVDIDYFNGTSDELRKYAGLGEEVPPQPPEDTVCISENVARCMHQELEEVFR
jgi:lysozyme